MNDGGIRKPGKWQDLWVRAGSGLALALAGLVLIWLGDWWFSALVLVGVGVMAWELAAMTAPRPAAAQAVLIGLAAAASLGFALWMHRPLWLGLMVLPAVAGLVTPRRDRWVYAVYTMAIMFTGYGLVAFRDGFGRNFVLWLVLLVAFADMMGYFGGRLIGGPKFWPRVSPKKTWSGTIAGWIGALIVGWAFSGTLGSVVILFSPIVAFAGQMGDIAESAIKRRAGVKDSSNLIPGHGGVLDRFDAVIFAALIVAGAGVLCPFPW